MEIVRKSSRPFAAGASTGDDRLAVVLEPKSGCSIQEVEQAANASNAQQMERLTDRMLSAVVDAASMPLLSSVAHVSIKQRKIAH